MVLQSKNIMQPTLRHPSVPQQAQLQISSEAQQHKSLHQKLTAVNGAVEKARTKSAEDAELILSLEAQVCLICAMCMRGTMFLVDWALAIGHWHSGALMFSM